MLLVEPVPLPNAYHLQLLAAHTVLKAMAMAYMPLSDLAGSVAGGTDGFPPQGFPTVGKPFRRRFSSPTSGEAQGSSVSNFKKC